MAETDFGRTSHHGIARAEVRITTPADPDAALRVERSDPSSYSRPWCTGAWLVATVIAGPNRGTASRPTAIRAR